MFLVELAYKSIWEKIHDLEEVAKRKKLAIEQAKDNLAADEATVEKHIDQDRKDFDNKEAERQAKEKERK